MLDRMDKKCKLVNAKKKIMKKNNLVLLNAKA